MVLGGCGLSGVGAPQARRDHRAAGHDHAARARLGAADGDERPGCWAVAVTSGDRDGPAERGHQHPGVRDADQDGRHGRCTGAGDDRPGRARRRRPATARRPYQSAQYARKAEGLAGQAGGRGVMPRRRRPATRVSAWAGGLQIAAEGQAAGRSPGGRGQPGRGERGGGQRADGPGGREREMRSAAGGWSCCSATRWAGGCRPGS